MSRLPSEIVLRDGCVYHLGLAPGQLAPNVFQVGDPARAYRVARRFELVEHEVRNREYVTLTGRIGDLPVSVVGTGIGTDNVEIAMIEALAVHGFDLSTKQPRESFPPMTWIRIGTSGGVQPDVQPGTFGIAEYAVGLDSGGFYYEHGPSDPLVTALEREIDRLIDESIAGSARFKGKLCSYGSKASPDVFAALRTSAQNRGVPLRTGVTVSTPGFYGASGRYIEGLRNTVPYIKKVLASLNVEGRTAINFEMESSLMFHLAEALGFRAGTICTIISQPTPGDPVIDYEPLVEECIDIAVEAMIKLRVPSTG